MLGQSNQANRKIQIYSTPDAQKYSLENGVLLPEQSLISAKDFLSRGFSGLLVESDSKGLEEYHFPHGEIVRAYDISVYSAKPAKQPARTSDLWKKWSWPKARIVEIINCGSNFQLQTFLRKNLALRVSLKSLEGLNS